MSDRRESIFLLARFLRHEVLSSMLVNAAGLLRRSLQNLTATSCYKLALDKLKTHSVQIDGDAWR